MTSAVTITDYDVGGECGRSYAKGQAYLIYAQKDRRREAATDLTTTFCSRVFLKSEADAERRRLGKGPGARAAERAGVGPGSQWVPPPSGQAVEA